MPDCEMCVNNSDKCNTIDLTITSNFDKDEQPFERNSTICLECKNKIVNMFSKYEDDSHGI
ncbi:MAG: hypothetical protein K0S93_2023 [Nitrososphaeraceae archaeon]|nr:hypothetical protein [Nitrososphaeraceae archaeon]